MSRGSFYGRAAQTLICAILLAAASGAIFSIPAFGSTPIAPQVPVSMKNVSFLGYNAVVPVSWQIVDLRATPTACVHFDLHAVYLGVPGPTEHCPAHLIATKTEALLIEPLSARDGAAGMVADPVAHEYVIADARAGVEVIATYGSDQDLIKNILERAAVTPDHATAHSAASQPVTRSARSPARSAAGPLGPAAGTPGSPAAAPVSPAAAPLSPAAGPPGSPAAGPPGSPAAAPLSPATGPAGRLSGRYFRRRPGRIVVRLPQASAAQARPIRSLAAPVPAAPISPAPSLAARPAHARWLPAPSLAARPLPAPSLPSSSRPGRSLPTMSLRTSRRSTPSHPAPVPLTALPHAALPHAALPHAALPHAAPPPRLPASVTNYTGLGFDACTAPDADTM
jgi:hypothetical protein